MCLAKLPTFAVGSFEKVQPAVDAGILAYPSYVFVRDTNEFIFIDEELRLRKVVGDNPKQVICVDCLPDAAEACADVLYICGGVVYLFDGACFKPVYQDVADRLGVAEEALEALRVSVDGLVSSVVWVEL